MLHSSGGEVVDRVGNMETWSSKVERLMLEEALEDIVEKTKQFQARGQWN